MFVNDNPKGLEAGRQQVERIRPRNLAYFSRFRNNESVGRIVSEVIKQLGCRTAILYAMEGDSIDLLYAEGLSLVDVHKMNLPTLERMRFGSAPFEFVDMASMAIFDDEAFVHVSPGWRYAINAPISFEPSVGSDIFVSLICFDTTPRWDVPLSMPTLLRFVNMLGDLMSLMPEASTVAIPNDETVAQQESVFQWGVTQAKDQKPLPPRTDLNLPIPPKEPDHAVAQFLQNTLIKRPRLRNRKSVYYLALRSWAKPIKPYQINALRAIKAAPTASLIEEISVEMALAIKSIHGLYGGASVVPVPCGHSGPDCLSKMLAQALARQLSLKCVEAFVCQPQSGSSHPKTNLRRPKMKLREEIKTPVILVDDVATSGAHIEEAARLLSATALSVWPIVWVSD